MFDVYVIHSADMLMRFLFFYFLQISGVEVVDFSVDKKIINLDAMLCNNAV